MGNKSLTMMACIFVFCVAAIVSSAQTLKTLASFNATNGSSPEYMSLVQGFDGNFYGTTEAGGAYGKGVVFKVTPSGTLTTIYSFCAKSGCTDGANPWEGLVQATNGSLYGVTTYGGTSNRGTIFKITAGTLTTLYSFCAQSNCPDGAYPYGALVQANGDFYGTTNTGGAYNNGTVFKITSSGTLTTLYSFCAGGSPCSDGTSPFAGLVLATNGDFYGTTTYGGTSSNCPPYACGTVFKITPSGTLTTLYSFDLADGDDLVAPVIQATNGDLYGTTAGGGAGADPGSGTVFQLTLGGTLTTLTNFCGANVCSYGGVTAAPVAQATDGNFYGTTPYGGGSGHYGTVFEITSSGTLTDLYAFCSQTGCADGSFPAGGLLLATNGIFYGTTSGGGSSCGCGTIFSLSTGLGPFVETLPTSGKVGAKVIVLGNTLKGATSVTFNGTAATFTVVSGTEITATVPTGSTTGTVEVVTSKGKTLKSNVVFRVIQ